MSIMDQLIENGEDITLFGDSKLYVSPEFGQLEKEISALYRRLLDRCGPEIEELLDQYTEAVETKEDYIAEHYFDQGFLAARRGIIKQERD